MINLKEIGEVEELLKILEMSHIINSAEIDGILIKKMAESNLMSENRSSSGNQTHIALTSKERALFPTVITLSYLDGEDDKKFYDIKLKIKLYEENIKKLEENCEKKLFVSSEFEGGTLETYTKCYTRRGTPDYQIQISKVGSDDENFIKFRKLIFVNDYIVFIKLKDKLEFICWGLKRENSTKIIDKYTKDENILYLRDTTTSLEVNDIFKDYDKNEKLPYQKIVYGAPGTGKSYSLLGEAKRNFG